VQVQRETGRVVLIIAYTTDVIVGRVCEGGDLELPIDGVGTQTNLGTMIHAWERVRQDGCFCVVVHEARAATCCEIFV
jgi:hypothetical protein